MNITTRPWLNIGNGRVLFVVNIVFLTDVNETTILYLSSNKGSSRNLRGLRYNAWRNNVILQKDATRAYLHNDE